MISHERQDRLVGQILPGPIARAIANFANRRTAANHDAVVCTTGFARKEFDRIHAPNVVIVPLGVDLDQFHPSRRSAQVRQRWGRPEQTLLVHCGRLSVEKHAHRSIDTVAALRDSGVDVKLVVVGEGPLRGRLERQAARLPVDFTGYLCCRDTVAAILASADVALAPGPHETFGLAALEALACGTPAVVSRTSALAEILTTDCGATADNHADAIAQAVTAIISKPERLRRNNARRQAEQFTCPRAAAGMLDALGAG
jgi:alpha-1,6-mannosyltransferase